MVYVVEAVDHYTGKRALYCFWEELTWQDLERLAIAHNKYIVNVKLQKLIGDGVC